MQKIKSFLKKVEFSKLLCGIIVAVIALVAVFAVVGYYHLTEKAIEYDSTVAPVADVAVEALRGILYAILTYCAYQFGLKNSRNKYGIDKDGNPQIETMLAYLDRNGYTVMKKENADNFEEEIT